jgi:hypothetical protein
VISSLRAAAIALLLELFLVATPAPARATSTGAPSSVPAPAPAPEAPRAEAKKASIPPLPPEYQVQEEGWLRLAYHPSARERARALVKPADAFRSALIEELGAPVLSSVEVRLAAAVPGERERLSPPRPPSAEGAAVFTDLRLIVMSLPSPLELEPPSLADTLRRELALLALDEALGPAPPRADVPRWFREGYAAHVAGAHRTLRAQTLCMASLRGDLLSLEGLASELPSSTPQASVAYAQAADFVRFLTQPSSKGRFASLIAGVKSGDPFERALGAAYGADAADIELAWRKDMARRYSFLPVLLGSTIVWVAAAALFFFRRSKSARERRPPHARLARRAEPEARARAVTIPAGSVIAASRARAAKVEGATLGEAIPPDADVPKVEHEGQWHTLH